MSCYEFPRELLPQDTVRAGSQQYVFLMGHMRSGSSLLLHILVSNPEIGGYGETHRDYTTRSDLSQLQNHIRDQVGSVAANRRLILDKILHNYVVLGDEVLGCDKGCLLFLVREPRPAIASLMRQFPDWFSGTLLPHEVLLSKAVSYYHARLRALLNVAIRTGDRRRMLFITYGELLQQTPAVFSAIEELLGLAQPLREEYDVLPTTGRIGFGDPSPCIHKQYIDREKAEPQMEGGDLRGLESLFTQVCARMHELCHHVCCAK